MARSRSSKGSTAHLRTVAPAARGASGLAPWAVITWLLIWQIASIAWGSPLLLPGPTDVAARLIALAPDPAFWQRVLFTLSRIAGGYLLAAAIGIAAALGAARWRTAEELFAPLMALAKSVPVASITVLALVWLRAANLAVFVVFLVVLPLVYANTLAGLRAVDPALDEAAKLFSINGARRLRFLVMPRLYPYLETALGTALGMAWKAGVAAEVIGIPTGSLGEAVYDAKVYFDTPGLFAVTLAIVIASAATTGIVKAALRALEPIACGAAGHAKAFDAIHSKATDRAARAKGSGVDARNLTHAASTIHLTGITKAFAGLSVLDGITFDAHPGTPVCLMAPSGSGKTTLLRIAAGLSDADAGSLIWGDAADRDAPGRVSMVFQDDRLADQASILANVRLPLEADSTAWHDAPALLSALGLGEHMLSPVGTCSGGERRRIALARALLADHDLLLLDEPFAGLDEATHKQVAALVAAHERSAVVIVATHDRHDADLLDARVISLARKEASSNGALHP